MASDRTKRDDLLDRLVLEIKAVALLYGSEVELREVLHGRLTGSHDESVRRFVSSLQGEGRPRTGRLLAIALGELVMASLLVIAGTVILVPTAAGVNTLSALVQYFAERTAGTAVGSPLSPYLSFVEFALGVVLALCAFFALREAATNFKQVGLALKSVET